MKFLDCQVKNYDWGKRGSESYIAKLFRNLAIDSSAPYAELWVGTHPSGMSFIKDEKQSLKSHLGKDLRFLFKVLSVRKALSIQIHPDKRTAEKLHSAHPQIYVDDNHKPELCYAVTDFEMLFGFRPLREILSFAEEYAEFGALVKSPVITTKSLFSEFIRTDSQVFEPLLGEMISRLWSKEAPTHLDGLILRLSAQYPRDIGVFSPLLFNVVRLRPGESVFIPPNVPHSYVSGDCFECLACSDNVIRCALTPKHKDLDLFVDLADFEAQSEYELKPVPVDSHTRAFYFPQHDLRNIDSQNYDEFRLEVTRADGDEMCEMKAKNSPSVVLVHKGSAKYQSQHISVCSDGELKAGDVFALKDRETVAFEKCEDLELIRCSEFL